MTFNARAEHQDPILIKGTFAQSWEEYSLSPAYTDLAKTTRYHYRRLYNRVAPALGPFRMADIGRDAIYEVQKKFENTPREGNHAVELIRVLFSWMVDRERLTSNPAKGIKRLKVSPRQQV